MTAKTEHKVRVHELAKEFNMTSAALIEYLQKEGVSVSSHLSALDPETVELVKMHFADVEDDVIKPKAKPIPEIKAIATSHKVIKYLSDDVDDKYSPIETIRKPKAEHKIRTDEVEKIPPPGRAHQEIREARKSSASEKSPAGTGAIRELHLKTPIIVRDLAEAIKVKPNELIHELMKMNVFAAISQSLDVSAAESICKKYGFRLTVDKRDKQALAAPVVVTALDPEYTVYPDEHKSPRPPIVTVLGHVDHGKTSLLDRIRKSNITTEEAGGITQHIGASSIEWNNHAITFIDTPGHEAFTAMRSRGASATDIAILVVAADDGFMPQTIEALNHAKAAKVPIIVAINKMDLPSADPMRVLTDMQKHELTHEEWGGTTGVVEVSAITGQGIDQLLDRILLEAEILELKANPDLPGRAVVIEAQLEQGLGPTVNILVKNGSIKVGDNILCTHHTGKVKALIDQTGKKISHAGPSQAVKVVGLEGVPECGAILVVCDDEKQVKRLAEERLNRLRETQLQPRRQTSLDDLFRQIKEEERKELKLIIKSDVQGTGEAIVSALKKQESPKVKLDIIHCGVGAISDNDVLLAAATDAVIAGFHVRVNPGVNGLANRNGVEIRLYSIIYEMVEQIKEAMEGMLDPELRESSLGKCQILQIFELSKGGKVCGCSVQKGLVRVGAKARVFRNEELIYNGSISNLRRFYDDVKEVKQGFECGIRLDNFADFETGDIIDVYEYKEFTATL